MALIELDNNMNLCFASASAICSYENTNHSIYQICALLIIIICSN
jgi:hypothetical protein